MTRNLKALGLALVAVFALSAMAASSASAVDTFTTSVSPQAVTGNSTTINKFEITGVVKVECAKSTFSGSLSNGAKEVTFTPTYAGTPGVNTTGHCNSTFGKAEVNMNGCAYILTGNTTGSDGGTDATVWIECTPPGGEVVITFPSVGTTLGIPAQTSTSGGVTYTNVVGGSKNKVDINATVTGITYTCTPAFLCNLGGVPTEGNNADYTGHVLAEGSGTNNISFSVS